MKHPLDLPQALQRCEKDVEEAKKRLIIHEYDPDSVAKVQASSRPGQRKKPETWKVSLMLV
jgi:hypothetical protein